MLTADQRGTLGALGATIEPECVRLATSQSVAWRHLPTDPAEDVRTAAVGVLLAAAQHAERAKTFDRDPHLSPSGKTARRSESDRATLPRLGEALARIAELRREWQRAADQFHGKAPAAPKDWIEAQQDSEIRRWLETAPAELLLEMARGLEIADGADFDPRIAPICRAYARAAYPLRDDLRPALAAVWKRLQEIEQPETAARLRVRDEHTGWLVVVGQQCAAAVRGACVVGEAEQFAAIDRAGGEPALLLAGWHRSQFAALRVAKSATLPAAA